MQKANYSNQEREAIFESLHGYLAQAPRQFERAEQYLTEHPRASAQELQRAGFSRLLAITNNQSEILKEYLGIETPKEPIKRKKQFLRGTNTDKLLEANFQQRVIDKLVNYRNAHAEKFTSAIDYLAKQHYQNKKSILEIARETEINYVTLRKLFKEYYLPIRPQAEAVRKNWEDEDFRKRHAEATRKNWEDGEFRKRNAEAVREMLGERWKDEDFRKRNAEAVRKNWEDEDFRKRHA
ncbi:MAG: hypothetical protein AABY16_03670, partial [Nanoarchaeota archaeon]